MKPVLLSVVIDNDGSNYTSSSSKKAKVQIFNADNIVTAKNLDNASVVNGSCQITVTNYNWNTPHTFNVAETEAQVTTAIDNSSTNAFADANLSITAHAGGGQASAVALTNYWNKLTTVTTAGDSVLLPDATTHTSPVIVQNSTANSANVFPASGQKIDSGAANADSAVAGGKTVIFWSNGTQWYTLSY